MGLIRKTISVSTLGIVDYRSDKERIARSARLTKQAVKAGNREQKKQTRLMREQLAIQAQSALAVQNVVSPAGWYEVEGGMKRWYDGAEWTNRYLPASDDPPAIQQ